MFVFCNQFITEDSINNFPKGYLKNLCNVTIDSLLIIRFLSDASI